MTEFDWYYPAATSAQVIVALSAFALAGFSWSWAWQNRAAGTLFLWWYLVMNGFERLAHGLDQIYWTFARMTAGKFGATQKFELWEANEVVLYIKLPLMITGVTMLICFCMARGLRASVAAYFIGILIGLYPVLTYLLGTYNLGLTL